jgi:hypothetical protein
MNAPASNDFNIERIQATLNCPSLEMHMSPLWGAETAEHRFRIRQFLLENIRACGGPEKIEDILNLEKVPVMSATKLSISHCPEFGIIVFAKNPVGVDVENIERIHDSIASRMATAQEFSSAPNAASLWVAKESAYKALYSFRQPPVMSQIETGRWQKLDSHSETFELLNHQEFDAPAGKGLVIRNKLHALSIFVFQT